MPRNTDPSPSSPPRISSPIHHHRRRRPRLKNRERNFLSAVCSTLVIATLCTAMAEPQWFNLRGGGCNINNLGIDKFFYVGTFLHRIDNVGESKPMPKQEYRFSSDDRDTLLDCVDPKTVQIMKSIIILCFLGVCSSLLAFFLDLFGPTSLVVKFMRRNAIWNIFTVLICVTINGFCYWVTILVRELQIHTKPHAGSKVEVSFDIGFYLVAGAGAMSVVASACNLLRRYPTYDSEQNDHLLNEYDETDHSYQPEYLPPMSFMPPPPAYAP